MPSSMNMPESILAAVNRAYGPPEVVALEKIPCPKVGANTVLIRVHAASVSTADLRLRSLKVPRGFGFVMRLLFGFSKPRYRCLGTDLAGTVVAVGPRVRQFKEGDRVFANQGMKLGGHAEYCALPETAAIAHIPATLSFEEAAALCFGGMTALSFLRDQGRIKKGERLLVIGAGGCVGSAAVQLGKSFGAIITGVASSDKAATVRGLGADVHVDYRKVDWRNQPENYDVIFDTIGSTSFEDCRHKLNPGGRLLLAVADLPTVLGSALIPRELSKKVIAGAASEKSKDLRLLGEMAEQGTFKPLIGNVLPFSQIVDAHRIVESGSKTGSVIVSMV